MKTSIVIPNYNGEELLKKNLPKVIDVIKDIENIEIIVVDDASTDNSELAVLNLKSQNQNIKFIRSNKNLGFSSTVNLGVEKASGEIVVLLNTDAIPEKDFLEPLLKHFKNEKVFAVGCMDKSIENGKIVLRGRGIGGFKRGFLAHARGEVDKSNTLWVAGGSGAFRKSIWEKLGGLNTLYNPFYYEDIDLSYRALKSGYKLAFENESIVIHEHEKGAIRTSYSKSNIKTTAYRNQFIFVWLNITDSFYKIQHLLWFPYHFFKAIFSLDFAFFGGAFRAFLILPKIIQSRSKYRRLFVKSDKEIFQNFRE